MKVTIQVLLTIALILIVTGKVMAQPGLPGAPSQAPIDGGLSILAAAGSAYAIKKLRDRKNREDQLD